MQSTTKQGETWWKRNKARSLELQSQWQHSRIVPRQRNIYCKGIDGKTKPNPLAGNTHFAEVLNECCGWNSSKVCAQIHNNGKEQAEWNSKYIEARTCESCKLSTQLSHRYLLHSKSEYKKNRSKWSNIWKYSSNLVAHGKFICVPAFALHEKGEWVKIEMISK